MTNGPMRGGGSCAVAITANVQTIRHARETRRKARMECCHCNHGTEVMSFAHLCELTLVRQHDYHHGLFTQGPIRSISLESVREAAATVYQAAIRTPLLAIDLADTGSPLDTLYLKLES